MAEWLNELIKPGYGGEGLPLQVVIAGLLIALVLSWLIALVYKRVNRDREELYVMMHTLVLLAVTIAAAMMIIGNNLARAFGLVGAVSIIRFRTAVKNSKDMAFVFLAIVIGMACGLGFRLLALVFTGSPSTVLGDWPQGLEGLGQVYDRATRKYPQERFGEGRSDDSGVVEFIEQFRAGPRSQKSLLLVGPVLG